MKKLKIAFVCPYDYFRFGGVQEHIRAVKEELNKLGHEAYVIAPNASNKKTDEENVFQIGSAANVNTPMATSAEVTFSATPGEIKKILNQQKFDILHFHEPWVPMLSKQVLNRSKSTNIATFHAKLPDNFVNKSIEKAVIPYGRQINKKLDKITAVSAAAKDFVSKTTEKPIEIVPNGIDLKKYDPVRVDEHSKFEDEKINILYVGRLEKRKGVNYLLKAYKQIQNNDVRLIIAGDGPKLKSLKAYVKRYKIKNVELLGFVSEEEKLSLLKTSDIFCSPAIYGESFGIVLLEAMAMNCAVVAGDNPGYTSVMIDRGLNSIVNVKDTDSFARKLELLVKDKPTRDLMIDWQKQYVKKFDYKLITQQYIKLYNSL